MMHQEFRIMVVEITEIIHNFDCGVYLVQCIIWSLTVYFPEVYCVLSGGLIVYYLGV